MKRIDISFVMQKYNISDCLPDMILQRLTIISIMFLLQFSQRPAHNLLHQCLKLVSASSEHRSTTLLYNWFCTVHCHGTLSYLTVFFNFALFLASHSSMYNSFCTMTSCVTWHTGKSQSRLLRLALVSFQWRQHILCYVRSSLKYIHNEMYYFTVFTGHLILLMSLNIVRGL